MYAGKKEFKSVVVYCLSRNKDTLYNIYVNLQSITDEKYFCFSSFFYSYQIDFILAK